MKKWKFFKKPLIIIIIAIIAIIIVSIIVKYQVEGESNIPFEVSKVMVLSKAIGIQKEDPKAKWDMKIVQNNNIYLEIIKNKNYGKDEIIEKVILDNFTIGDAPQKGNIVFYGPQSGNNGVYQNKEEYKIKEQIEFIGNEEKSDIKNLQISNQGGLILIRVVNEDLGEYTSQDDAEIRHDGTLLGKVGVNNEELKTKIEFDLSIELKSEKRYKTHIELEMPIGNILEEGTTNYQIDGKEELVFKRY